MPNRTKARRHRTSSRGPEDIVRRPSSREQQLDRPFDMVRGVDRWSASPSGDDSVHDAPKYFGNGRGGCE